MGFKGQLVQDFTTKFPGVRAPGKNAIKEMWEKQIRLGTILNCNSKSSPGNTYSGRPRTSRTPANMVRVKAVMDRDAPKVITFYELSADFLLFTGDWRQHCVSCQLWKTEYSWSG